MNCDLILTKSKIYTIDSNFSIAEAMAIKDGKIVETGTNEYILGKYDTKKIIPLKNKFIYPGFIDAHCHFLGYGLSLQQINLMGTKSVDDIISILNKITPASKSDWIMGRGWDQNDWVDKKFPDNTLLNKLFPDNPVYLKRIDGHAAWVNNKALELAGIKGILIKEFLQLEGGEILHQNGKPTGILIDNAMELIEKIIPSPTPLTKTIALTSAEKKCFQVGLTTVSDAGLELNEILLIDSLQKNKKLKMRIYAMCTDSKENIDYFFTNGKYRTDNLNVSSFKFYADGALGSRGAFLTLPYSDQPDHFGFLLRAQLYYEEMAQKLYEKGFQMNTHCIGDKANHILLDIYSKVLKEKNDKRWRIEHAQVIDPSDLYYFKDYSIVPSVQPVHATSDMYWAEKRLGTERIKYAYAYRTLLETRGLIANGSDFPVEDINPLLGFYAAVVRKDTSGFPESGFMMENAISRMDALKAMTIWAAYANFEEDTKGSLEPGKYADFVVLDRDIMTIIEKDIFKARVLETYLNGEKVY